MATFLKKAAFLILLLGVLTHSTNADFNETWLPTDYNITYFGQGWSYGWDGFLPSTCFLSTTAAKFTGTPGDYATVQFRGMSISEYSGLKNIVIPLLTKALASIPRHFSIKAPAS
jgi:hypothetical protein